MKRIETLSENDRLAVVRTLNDAALNGDVMYSCAFVGATVCNVCPLANECGALYIDEFPKKSFVGWLNWLCDDVDAPAINTGFRVFVADRINWYCIERDDDLNFNTLYAEGRPLTALFFDQQFSPDLMVIDVFASRYGVTCILVKDRRDNKNWLYIDKAI